MRKPPRFLIITAIVPIVSGCFGVLPSPVPPPAERASADVRGVVLSGDSGQPGEEVRFTEIYQANWTQSALFIAGTLSEGEGLPPVDATREYEYDDLEAVLLRKIDAGKTSIVMAIAIVGAIAGIALWVNGQTTDDTVLGGPPAGALVR